MSDQLTRQLRGRHIQLIAIGGTIGVGLFLGSAKAIRAAGPGLLVSHVLAGAAVVSAPVAVVPPAGGVVAADSLLSLPHAASIAATAALPPSARTRRRL